jgi:hypothetical protein
MLAGRHGPSLSPRCPKGADGRASSVIFQKSLNLERPFDAVMWAAATLSFWGMARLGAVLVDAHDRFDPDYHPSTTCWAESYVLGERVTKVLLSWS